MRRKFSPCQTCAGHSVCKQKCITFMDWKELGYWEDYIEEVEEYYDEREEAFTPQERNPSFRSW